MAMIRCCCCDTFIDDDQDGPCMECPVHHNELTCPTCAEMYSCESCGEIKKLDKHNHCVECAGAMNEEKAAMFREEMKLGIKINTN